MTELVIWQHGVDAFCWNCRGLMRYDRVAPDRLKCPGCGNVVAIDAAGKLSVVPAGDPVVQESTTEPGGTTENVVTYPDEAVCDVLGCQAAAVDGGLCHQHAMLKWPARRAAVDRRPLVIYHADCWDGFCAAWLIHKYATVENEFMPAQYGQPAPDVTGRLVVMVDFSYPQPELQRMADQAQTMLVLDHHASAEESLKSINAGPLWDYEFHNEKSGARLTWEWIVETGYATGPAPWLVDYTEDRDLWRWALPDSQEINAVIRSYPLTFEAWDALGAQAPDVLFKREGRAILRAEQVVIADHVRKAREVELLGHKVLSVNATSHFSEIAGQLAEGRPFGMAWFERQDGLRQFSLRSRPDGLDVSEIAKEFGGGGHKHAAGFELPNSWGWR